MPSLFYSRSTAVDTLGLVATLGLVGAALAALLAGIAVAAPAFGDTTAGSSGQEARVGEHPARGAEQRPAPRVVRQWAEAWNSGSPEQMAGLFTDDGIYEDHAFQATFQGKDAVAQWVSVTTGAIDDVHVEVTGASRRGGLITVGWIFSGRDTAGGLGGQPPTGNAFSVPAVSTFQMKGNKIQRVDDYYDLADLLRQLYPPSGAQAPPTD